MFRQRKVKQAPLVDSKGFRMRGTQVSRIEGISDAVFGLAITLIVVSLQVPRTFDELLLTLRGFIGSGLCTLFLLQIWNRHYLYFRRYGLEDGTTRTLNGILLFVVIAYVYPLKFLFQAFFGTIFKIRVMDITLKNEDLPALFVIYGSGFALVYILFGFMYGHALRKSEELELSNLEQLESRSIMVEHWLMAVTGLVSVALALSLKPPYSAFAGFAYFLIPVFLTVHWSKHWDQVRKLQVSPDSELGAADLSENRLAEFKKSQAVFKEK